MAKKKSSFKSKQKRNNSNYKNKKSTSETINSIQLNNFKMQNNINSFEKVNKAYNIYILEKKSEVKKNCIPDLPVLIKIKVIKIKKKQNKTISTIKNRVINIRKKVNKKRDKKFNNFTWILGISLFIGVFCFSLFKIIMWQLDNNNYTLIEDKILNKINITEVTSNTKDFNIVSAPTSPSDIYWKYLEVPLIDVDFTNLKKENNDTVGWIQVPGTLINYPIVQTSNNNYYLNHDFLKTYNSGGWIFLDYRNNITDLSDNNIIYGHERFNTSMFGSLKNVLTKNWLNNTDNHVIKISTPKYNYLFQIFSVYTVENEVYYIQDSFKDNNLYSEFLNTITNRSIHNFNTEINTDTKILTLSTCHNSNDRLVVHSKLIKITK